MSSAPGRWRSPSPLVLGYAIDDLTRGVTRAKLAGYGALLLGIGLVSGVFLFLQRRILIGASRDIEYDMRNDFFAHLETLPHSYFQTHRTGDLMSRATNDLNAVRMMIGPSIMYSANTMLTLVVALFVMIGIDARLTLFALIPMPFVSISVKVFGSAIHKRFEQIQAQLSDVSAVAQESLSGVRVVRAYRQEHAELERFRRSNEEYLRRNRRLIVAAGVLFSEHVVLPRPRRAARALARRQGSHAGTDVGRRVRRVQLVSDDAELADDCVRVGHQHAAARHGVVEADAGGA